MMDRTQKTTILLEEVNLSEPGNEAFYEINATSIVPINTSQSKSSEGARFNHLNKLRHVSKILATILLPKGYPESVCPEYVRFQFWDTSQEACGYFRTILSNQAYLISIGVGNPAISVFSAIVTTMILDYVRMVSGLIAASSSQAIQTVAINQKFWTMFKEILCFIACIMTMLSAYHQEYVIIFLAVGNVVKALEGVIAGCCHATLVTHIARQNNFSDCNAKEGNQSRALKFIIIGLGYKFLILVHEDGRASLLAFMILSILKLWCQYNAMKSLKLRTLSPKRLELCVKAWKENRFHDIEVASVASKEAVLFPQYSKISKVGARIQDLSCSGAHLTRLIKIHNPVHHVLVVDNKKVIFVLLKVGASSEDILKAFVHAHSFSSQMNGDETDDTIALKIKDSLERTTQFFPQFIQTLQYLQWDIDNMTLLPASTYRLQNINI